MIDCKKIFKIFIISFIVIIIAGAVFFATFLKNTYSTPILMYHSVDTRPIYDKLNITPKDFDRQMAFLKRHHYNVILLESLINLMKENKKMPLRTVIITFDDGYKNNFVYAYPILKEFRFPATIFIIVKRVGDYGILSWSDIIKMNQDGIDIGSHTMSHPDLATLPEDKIKYELTESKSILEEKLGKKVKFLSYPLGSFNKMVREIAAKAGYSGAVANKRGSYSDTYILQRVKISGSDNLFTFWAKVSGYYNTFRKR